MNGVALRAEKALVDYLAAGDWSGAGAGTPSFLTSYSRGLYDDPDAVAQGIPAKKLGDPEWVESVRGVGFALKAVR